MRIINVTPAKAEAAVRQVRADGREACVCSVADAPCAIVGSNGGSDEDAAKFLGILVVHMGNEGGTIVANTGDVDIGIFTNGYSGNDIRDRLIGLISEEGKANSGAEIMLDGNDYMVNGRKVIGCGSRMHDGVLYTAMHIAIHSNVELVRKICTKRMSKVPGALSEYGVTTEFVTTALQKAIKEYRESGEN